MDAFDGERSLKSGSVKKRLCVNRETPQARRMSD
jgi:hypothetical protein